WPCGWRPRTAARCRRASRCSGAPRRRAPLAEASPSPPRPDSRRPRGQATLGHWRRWLLASSGALTYSSSTPRRAAPLSAPALFPSDHLATTTAGIDRTGPAGVERHVSYQPLQLGLRHPVVERPLHVAPHLVGPVERSQDRHRDQAPIALAE